MMDIHKTIVNRFCVMPWERTELLSAVVFNCLRLVSSH